MAVRKKGFTGVAKKFLLFCEFESKGVCIWCQPAPICLEDTLEGLDSHPKTLSICCYALADSSVGVPVAKAREFWIY